MDDIKPTKASNDNLGLDHTDLNVGIKSIRQAATENDGRRILVNRLWPKGLSKSEAVLAEWRPDLAPSWPLRRGLDLASTGWDEFLMRFRTELRTRGKISDLQGLAETAKRERITLVYTGRDPDHNVAAALLRFMCEL